MGKIVKAGAWCNGEVAYLSWQADAKIADCLGFMVTRVHETGPDAPARRILPTWIGFRDQSNPDWLDQDSSVWPIQYYQWRDLTLRRSRDTTNVRPIDFRVHYEIRPLGLPAPGRTPVPPSDTAPFLDGDGKRRYKGPQHPLAFLGPAFKTNSIDVTHNFGGGGADRIEATYTNGILSTQNLLQQLEAAQAAAHPGVPAGPTTGASKALERTLKEHIGIENDPIRTFLTADVLSFLLRLIDRAEAGAGELFCALYELHDPELVKRITKLAQAGKAHVILSTASNYDPNPKTNPPTPKKPLIWDVENHDARAGLHAVSANIQDRLFNNNGHIGHNKFLVYAENGKGKAVLTGSTNWTETGLCTQSNNAVLIESEKVAKRYLDYWKRLKKDVQPAGVPASFHQGNKHVEGFAPNKGVQGAEIRTKNAEPKQPLKLADGKTRVELFFAPNTQATTKNKTSPTPVDLSRVYSLMEHAEQAILFLTFYPGVRGEQNVIGEAARLLETKPGLLVQGAISNPAALPPAKPGEPTTYTTPTGEVRNLPQRAIWWPGGDKSRIAMVRAAAIKIQTGDLRPEILSAGHAIIHDKIVIIDPMDPVKCTVVTGSHNLGYKASYQNDENLLIIRGNQALAIAYAVHVLDVYDHYVMRAKMEDRRREALVTTGKEPKASSGGFLGLDDKWQKKWFDSNAPRTSREYFLGI